MGAGQLCYSSNKMPSESHPADRAIALSRFNPLHGTTDHAYTRGAAYPYSRDYYGPQSRYSLDGDAHFHRLSHPCHYPSAAVPEYAHFNRALPVAYGNGHYGHPVGPKGVYNMSSGNPATYGPLPGPGYPYGPGYDFGAYGPPATKGPYAPSDQ